MIRQWRWQRLVRDPAWGLAALCAALIAATWTVALGLADDQHDRAVEDARARSTMLARTFDLHVERALQRYELVTRSVEYDHILSGRRLQPEHLQRAARSANQEPVRVLLADADGRVTMAEGAVPPYARFDVDLLHPGAPVAGDFLVGRPQLDPITAQLVMTFSRRLFDRDGRLAGFVVVTATPQRLSDFFAKGDLGERGFVALIAADGAFRLARTGDLDVELPDTDFTAYRGRLVEARAGRAAMNAGPFGWAYVEMEPVDGHRLWAIAGVNAEDALAPFERQRTTLHRAAAAATLLLLLTFGALAWLVRRLRWSEVRMRTAANRDALTELPNRRSFQRLLETRLAQSRAAGVGVALLFVDIDDFKRLNDHHGHDAGDAVLREVGRLLVRCTRDGDAACRLGGDEFTIVLGGVEAEQQALGVAARVLQQLESPLRFGDHTARVSASIGVCVADMAVDTAGSMLQKADMAMYGAKSEGKGRLKLYTADLGRQAAQRRTLEAALADAVARREFYLDFQPKVTLCDRGVYGYEALVRWRHPERGVVPPAEFITLAEESGLIVPLGAHVIDTACRQLAAWHGQDGRWRQVAVNVSAAQFDTGAGLLRTVDEALRSHGVPGRCLEIEITESLLMSNPQRAGETLAALKRLGVRVAIDDFGTGYSSLASLQAFALDSVKIDRSFVKDLGVRDSAYQIARTILSLAAALKLDVVAEGVETEAQHRMLLQLGCERGQGYLYGRPQAPERFVAAAETAEAVS